MLSHLTRVREYTASLSLGFHGGGGISRYVLEARLKRSVTTLLAICMSSGSVEWNQIPFLGSTQPSPCRYPMSHQKSSFVNMVSSTTGIFVVGLSSVVPFFAVIV
ncbi:MAG: hypothetical protein AUI97_07185 [Crenarchaeota archaeon 13_1_40CM_3_52_17]|nr:MAG: hypothetical protein AUI97_07185 [Crenarchaeota archaeon 13_1_40CM_3_52_17]